MLVPWFHIDGSEVLTWGTGKVDFRSKTEQQASRRKDQRAFYTPEEKHFLPLPTSVRRQIDRRFGTVNRPALALHRAALSLSLSLSLSLFFALSLHETLGLAILGATVPQACVLALGVSDVRRVAFVASDTARKRGRDQA